MVNRSVKICAWRIALASLLLVPAAYAAAPLQLSASADNAEDVILPRGPGMSGDVVDLYLEVMLNDASTHRVMHFVHKPDGHFYAWTQNLQDAGINTNGLPSSQYVDLSSISELSFQYDEPAQRMQFKVDAARLNVALQTLNVDEPSVYKASASSGALLNYDLYGSVANGGMRSLAAYTEMRAFSNAGILSNTGYSDFQTQTDDVNYRRLDTTWSRSFQDQMVTLNVGDLISGGLSWSRPTRMGGIQLRRNFGVQPDLITFPLPAFFGQAALPSSVELYMNGVRQYSGQLAPGPYQISAMPNINGAGQGQVVMTDVLGRRSTVDFSYYNANQLLRAGLTDWSVELGAVRRNYGLESFSYVGKPAASGSFRQGISNWFTLEAHAEASDGLYLGGVGGVLEMGQAGLLSGAYAKSSGLHNGQQAAVSYDWLYRSINLEIGTTRAFGDYRDVAGLESLAPPLRSDRAAAGLALGEWGNASINYTRVDTLEDGRFRFAGLNYSVNLSRKITAYANATRNLDGASDTGLFVGISWSFADSSSATASWQRSGGQDSFGVGASHAVSVDGGTGWNLRAQQGQDIKNYQAEASYRGDSGQVTGGTYVINDAKSLYADLSGSLVAMDRAIFVTRRIDDAFALVSTDGIADVPVQLENRAIGHTDANGHYLLTGLSSWQPNRVSINALDLPSQVQVGSVKNVAVPVDRTGVIVDFALRTVHAAVVTLNNAHGDVLPLGSRVFLNGSKTETAMVGYDGQAYLEDLTPINSVKVTAPDGVTCAAQFAYPKNATAIPSIGPLLCH